MQADCPGDEGPAGTAGRWWTGALLVASFAGLLGLHLLEPDLGITWSYAHLGRHRALPWLGLALTALLPLAGSLAWSSPLGRRPPRRPSLATATVAILVLWSALAIAAFIAPAPQFTLDGWWFKRAVARSGTGVERWFLAVRTLAAASHWLRPAALSLDRFIIVAHTLLAAVALAALAGSCRLLARQAREAWAMALLACTAFGTLQVSIGYVDVYPFAVTGTALFFWTALRALAGEVHPGWPIAIAALGPFFYLGLVLLAPPALGLLLLTARGPDGARRALTAAAAGALAAGAATLPMRGLPFDWFQLSRRAWAGRAFQAGFLPDSSLLPGWYLWSGQHAGEVASTLVLVDPVGFALLAIAGGVLFARAPRRALDAPSIVLLLFVSGFLAYLWVMDPTYGAFADWDLFSYGAVGTSLLGAYAFVRLGRAWPRRFGFLLGLALAVSAVHLLARLNALDVEGERHVAESPLHFPPPEPGPSDASAGPRDAVDGRHASARAVTVRGSRAMPGVGAVGGWSIAPASLAAAATPYYK